MEIEDLQTFVQVADSGGVSAAARRLGIAKSIVSRRLFKLEAELGTQLMTRTTRRAALTEAGKVFRQHAVRICTELDTAREVMSPKGELRGLLRIAVPSTFGATHFAPVLAEFARRHPLLHVHSHYNDRYVDLVADGFDCAIRVGYLADSNLVAKRIGFFPVRLFASPNYLAAHGTPEVPDDVSSHQAVMIGTESWQFSQGRKKMPVHPQGRFKTDSAVGIAEAAAAGVGIAALPDPIAQSYVAAGTLVPILSKYSLPPVGIFVVRPPGEHLARKVRALIELLSERFSG